ncbi:hypothetical protein HU200_017659 [Digitaria exilis]|uniref:Uncharacterized protein n=1 Tax=Digitaria exilis TaxID=1010633 RepID=A0A835KHU7_9POAL|nr:hypothetical protein HU200_017659 [Digitaria exilis]
MSRGDALGSSSEFDKPIYLVAEQGDEPSAYSVIKIDAAAGGDKSLRARTVADLHNTQQGMSFVAAHSEHGSWIVGIGGRQYGCTIIFDPTTRETFRGPGTAFPKHEPVLISHGGEVYVISRRPQVVPYLDFEPWFQSLSFNNGVPSIDCGVVPSWSFLPPPPFFPCVLDPYEFASPPKITVTSYASVGSHILLSPQPELKLGTYGFHVVEKTWEKVCDENLPFAGQAVPLGGSLFAACQYSNPLTATALVFHMYLAVQNTAVNTTRLTIQEIHTVVSKEAIPQPLFCPLGKDSFCSIRLPPLNPIHDKSNRPNMVHIISTNFQIENTEATIQVKEHIHTYKCRRQFGLMDSAMPVVAALSM